MSDLFVRAAALWTPRYPSLDAWRSQRAAEPELPPATLLGARARGRASVLTRMIAEVVAVAGAQAQLDLASTPLLVGSAFGEMDTTMQLLAMMTQGDGALSPARFQSSVHNTAAGLISIATGNQRFSSCLAAGQATTSALLVEARAYLAERGGDLLIAMADERLPSMFETSEPYEAAAAALVLSSSPARAMGALGLEQRIARGAEPSVRYAALGPSPVAPMVALIDALDGRQASVELPAFGCAVIVPLGYEGS